MYETLLSVHSWLRWFVILFAFLAMAQGFGGAASGASFAPRGRVLGLLFMIGIDLQLVLGLALYFGPSPITQAAFADMKAAMRDPQLRFWAVEHIAMMVIAVVVAHIGNVRTKRATTDKAKYRTLAIFTLITLVIVLAAIPWPGRIIGRPLFR